MNLYITREDARAQQTGQNKAQEMTSPPIFAQSRVKPLVKLSFDNQDKECPPFDNERRKTTLSNKTQHAHTNRHNTL